jgi:pimeloyl-ACP methyl ester carboxylesterase
MSHAKNRAQGEPAARLRIDAKIALEQLDQVKCSFERLTSVDFRVPDHETHDFILQCETTVDRLVGSDSIYSAALREVKQSHANTLNTSHRLFYQVIERLRHDIEFGHLKQGPESGDAPVDNQDGATNMGSTVTEIVLLVHGIRTFASWQPMVKRVLEEIPHMEVRPIKFGYFDAFRFWCPIGTRNASIDDVRRQIQITRAEHPGARFSVIAHSFGTFAITEILREHPDIKLHRLVLSGSIIPRTYRWDYVRPRLATDIVNDYGTRDIWPVLATCLSWGYGDTGRHGFGRDPIIDRGHDYAHSDFFNEEFVRRFWKPWFLNGTLVPSLWPETAPPPSWGLSVLSIIPFQWILTILFASVLIWAVIEKWRGSSGPNTSAPRSTSTEVGNYSPSTQSGRGAQPDSRAASGDQGKAPPDRRLSVATSAAEEISVRAAALSQLVKAHDIPDRAAFELLKSLFTKMADTSDTAGVLAAESILDDAFQELIPKRENLAFSLTEFYAAWKDNMKLTSETIAESKRGVHTNDHQEKVKERQRCRDVEAAWRALVRAALFTRKWSEFESLNSAGFLAEHFKALRLVIKPLDLNVEGLAPGLLRQMLESDNRGVRLLGAVEAIEEERLVPELHGDAPIMTLARTSLCLILKAPSKEKDDFALAAATLGAIPYDKELAVCAMGVLLDEDASRRLASIAGIPEGVDRSLVDRRNAATTYLVEGSKRRQFSGAVEDRLTRFLQDKTQVLDGRTDDAVELASYGERIDACLKILAQMNEADLPERERGQLERRLNPETILAVDRLFELNPAILDRLGLGDARKEWIGRRHANR